MDSDEDVGRPLVSSSTSNASYTGVKASSTSKAPGASNSAEKAHIFDFVNPSVKTPAPKPGKLNQFLATAISGNDILGSCLYSAGLVAVPAGYWAPVCALMVVVLLYLYRSVYQESGEALPINGGTYTLLLNTSSKKWAAFAGSLTLISYVATAVVSANSAMHYLHELAPMFDVFWSVVVLLFLFAVVNLIGIRESAYNALAIFSIHLVTLVVYIVSCAAFVIKDEGKTLLANLNTPPPHGNLYAIFIGFSVSLLGITGFETSANYIEEQAKGVYPKVLRNAWWLVLFVNPIVAALSLSIVPAAMSPHVKTHLFSSTAYLAQGEWLKIWINIDAVLVLSGSVLTSFVGIQGLVYRMALDGCLPNVLTELSHMRRTQHQTILVFFLVAVSLHMICDADIRVLSGVYTATFVTLMGCFALGNAMLKINRSTLPRKARASWTVVIIALVGVGIGLLGTSLYQPDMMLYAVAYTGVVLLVVEICSNWIWLLKIWESFTRKFRALRHYNIEAREAIHVERQKGIIFIIQNESKADLRRVVEYILTNEERRVVKFVTVTPEPLSQAHIDAIRTTIDALGTEIHEEMHARRHSPFSSSSSSSSSSIGHHASSSYSSLATVGGGPLSLSSAGSLASAEAFYAASSSPSYSYGGSGAGAHGADDDDLVLQFEAVTGVLNGDLIDHLHERWNIPPNFMFIACPTENVTWSYGNLKGVRIIIPASTDHGPKLAASPVSPQMRGDDVDGMASYLSPTRDSVRSLAGG